MVKKISAILIAFSIMASSLACQEDVEIKNILVDGSWSQMGLYNNDDFGYQFSFSNDNKFTFKLDSVGFAEIQGHYEIRNGKLFTYPDKDSFGFENLLIDGLRWSINVDSSDSVMFRYNLLSEKGFFISDKLNPVQQDLERKIDGIDVMTVRHNDVELLDDSRIRTGPGTNYESLSYFIDNENLSYLPKGRHIIVLARTLEKHQIGQMLDYWYYIEVKLDPFVERGTVIGWIYGGFIDWDNAQTFNREFH